MRGQRSDIGATVRSRLRDGAVAAFDHQALARRHAPVWHRDLVEHPEIGLPARWRYHVAHVAALTVEELYVRLLGDALAEDVVDVVAVAVGGNRGADELHTERR